jgi:hypothetical protein
MGEFVGGVAVVVSVIYLSVQVRASRIAFEEAQKREAIAQEFQSNEYFHQIRMAIATDPDLADIEMRGIQDLGSLSELEQRRFHQHMTSWIWTIHKSYLQFSIDALRVNWLATLELHFRQYFNGPGFYQWWALHKAEFADEEFQAAIDTVIQKTNGEHA